MDSFFGIGFPELVLILLVAGIVMGPERIGQVARWLGRTTAQLQKISRGFVRQLNQELDNSGDGEAIKETMQELQKLRKELTDLRGEVNQTTAKATKASRQMFEEIDNSIKPPNLSPSPVPPPVGEVLSNGKPESMSEQNGSAEEEAEETAVPRLPAPLEVPDDPE